MWLRDNQRKYEIIFSLLLKIIIFNSWGGAIVDEKGKSLDEKFDEDRLEV